MVHATNDAHYLTPRVSERESVLCAAKLHSDPECCPACGRCDECAEDAYRAEAPDYVTEVVTHLDSIYGGEGPEYVELVTYELPWAYPAACEHDVACDCDPTACHECGVRASGPRHRIVHTSHLRADIERASNHLPTAIDAVVPF